MGGPGSGRKAGGFSSYNRKTNTRITLTGGGKYKTQKVGKIKNYGSADKYFHK